ncbi:hypothetical protein NDU88_005105 [Pleurodeles waltl]|uniref:Uncharacterized protein n=1 Tax=Pleurodeles waltl TaxID=8319 RepID=A0AAV7SKR9_PLEWA|nr:hypothetical protein NDU88_005105 [Pleurodeles waltl]
MLAYRHPNYLPDANCFGYVGARLLGGVLQVWVTPASNKAPIQAPASIALTMYVLPGCAQVSLETPTALSSVVVNPVSTGDQAKWNMLNLLYEPSAAWGKADVHHTVQLLGMQSGVHTLQKQSIGAQLLQSSQVLRGRRGRGLPMSSAWEAVPESDFHAQDIICGFKTALADSLRHS